MDVGNRRECGGRVDSCANIISPIPNNQRARSTSKKYIKKERERDFQVSEEAQRRGVAEVME